MVQAQGLHQKSAAASPLKEERIRDHIHLLLILAVGTVGCAQEPQARVEEPEVEGMKEIEPGVYSTNCGEDAARYPLPYITND